jgi:putative metallopeptidase DUF4344
MPQTRRPRRGLGRFPFVLGLAVVAAAADCRGKESANSPVQALKDSAFGDNPEACAATGCRFAVLYAQAGSPEFTAARDAVIQSNLLTDIADYLNSIIVLPRDIPIVFTSCQGVANAAYSEATHEIDVCYELLNEFATDFGRFARSDTAVAHAVRSATFFTVYHESGHALIHELGLPVTGKEEDAADQVATLLLLQEGEEGDAQAFESALWFLLQGASVTKVAQLKFWDEHSFDEQRFYNIACWIYGSNHNAHLDMIQRQLLPIARAERCEKEFQQMSQSWGTLLAPYLRQGAP